MWERLSTKKIKSDFLWHSFLFIGMLESGHPLLWDTSRLGGPFPRVGIGSNDWVCGCMWEWSDLTRIMWVVWMSNGYPCHPARKLSVSLYFMPHQTRKRIFSQQSKKTILLAICTIIALLPCITFRQPPSSSLTDRLLHFPFLVKDAHFLGRPS